MNSAPPAKLLHRRYSLKIAGELNSAKRQALESMGQEWLRTSLLAFDWYWASFWKRGLFNSTLPCSGPASQFPLTRLVTSQKELLRKALASQAHGWACNLAVEGRKIYRGIRDPALLHEVMWVNACRLWRASNADQNAALSPNNGPASISLMATRIARNWFNRHVKRGTLPDPASIPLQFNGYSGRLEDAKVSGHPRFRYWASLSTLVRGQRVQVPLESNEFFESAAGRLTKTMTLRRTGDDLYLDVVREVPARTWEQPGIPVLALDLGLRNLIATSEGDIEGENFIESLSGYDRKLQVLQGGLRNAGVTHVSKCRRHSQMVERIREFIKNSVHRCVRAVLLRHAPGEVVLERLTFVDGDTGLGPRMNRLLRGFGQAVFRKCVRSWSELRGFRISEVSAEYSSQMCSSCAFVHRANRKGNSFCCQLCGHQAHADVNAAKNLRGRSTLGAFDDAGGRHEWWAWALNQWLGRLRSRIEGATPGSSLQNRLVWRASTGISLIQKEKRDQEAARKVFQKLSMTLFGADDSDLYKPIRQLLATGSGPPDTAPATN